MPFSFQKRSAASSATLPLQRRLLFTFLPIVLLPLAIAGTWSAIVSHEHMMRQAEKRLKNQAKLTATLAHKELERKLTFLSVIAIDPAILNAAYEGNRQADDTKLVTLSIADAESKFAQTKRLKSDERLQNHLHNIAAMGEFTEVFFTERNGFNIAYTTPTSDFVQRDELWWQQGKRQRQWVGAVRFDDSTQHFALEMSQSIIDPKTQQFLGVLKAGYDAADLNHLEGELQNLQLLDTERMQILALDHQQTTKILTIAPTGASKEQEILGSDAIVQKAADLLKTSHYASSQNPEFSGKVNADRAALSPPVYEEFEILTQVIVVGDRWYAIAKIPGVNWVAISSIRLDQARSASIQLTGIFALVFLGLGGVATIMILRVSQRLAAPLNQLSEIVQQATEQAGFTVQAPVSTQNREARVLADSFNQLIQRVQQLLSEQLEAKQQLEYYNQTLEENVESRTQELNEKTQRLEETLKELRRTQTQIVQSEKMSSLGQLAAGIAHEINNPVNFIHGNVGHVKENTKELLELISLYRIEYPNATPAIEDKIEQIDLDFLQEDFPKLLNSMNVGTERIREIVKSLRIFSRLDEAEVKAIDIHEGMDSTLMILQNRLKESPDRIQISVMKDYASLPLVQCYAGQLNQVFMNILANSIDALEDLLATAPTHQPHIKIWTKQLDTNWIEIGIADNGPGMPEAIQQQIFDPFFTTKPVGKGTGMGMSISYQIITEKHQGQLECVSTAGQGTTFLIRIPIHQASQD
jgi:signal transduction histidine kinase